MPLGNQSDYRSQRRHEGLQRNRDELAAHIQFAVADRKTKSAKHLRDEMREHFRSREAGVLPVKQYEASKAEILAPHAPIRQPRRR